MSLINRKITQIGNQLIQGLNSTQPAETTSTSGHVGAAGANSTSVTMDDGSIQVIANSSRPLRPGDPCVVVGGMALG